MRILTIITIASVLLILWSCKNGKKPDQSDSETAEAALSMRDTLPGSIPLTYIKDLDTVKVSAKQEIRSYTDVLDLFEKLNYTPEAWQSGIREIPRVYLTIIGDRWGSTTTKEITVVNKKRLFFRGIAPLILRSNELILNDRKRMEEISSSFLQNTSISETDQIWLQKLAELYKVKTNEGQLNESMLEELWVKVDVVPPSLALAQGAEESGWGTSRFAAAGNAIYGQWTWGKNAIVPKEQRKELGNYGIAAFESLQESVSAYMLNLNTHNAYAGLRGKRAELRKNGDKISGSVLAEQLTKYSERGEEYVKTLKNMMDYNQLSPVDDAYLSVDPPIYLIPGED